MRTPWEKMSFLEKVWTCVKAAYSTPIGYTPSELAQLSSSSFDDGDSSLFCSSSHCISNFTFDDDSPTRGQWDPTSIYYPMMHSDDSSSIHYTHSSLFDD